MRLVDTAWKLTQDSLYHTHPKVDGLLAEEFSKRMNRIIEKVNKSLFSFLSNE